MSRSIGGRSSDKLLLIVSSILSSLALCLTVSGVYGTLSSVLGQRRNEIGIRLAIGASRVDIFAAMLYAGLRAVIGGILLGVVGSLVVARLASTLPFPPSIRDSKAIFGSGLILLFLSVVACLLPAYRATRTDPVATLRSE